MEKLGKRVLILAFIIGLYAPTSIHSEILPILPVIFTFLLTPLYLYYIYAQKRLSLNLLLISLGINLCLWMPTIFTPFSDYAFGHSLYYFVFSLMILMNLKEVQIGNFEMKVFNLINFINLCLCLLIRSGNNKVTDFFIQNYSMFYPEMTELAMFLKKPVIMFAAHSIAAYFLFIFFFINLYMYKLKNKIFYLIMSIGYIFSLFWVNSNTGYFFFFLSIIQFSFFLIKRKPLIFISLVCSILVFMFFNVDKVEQTYDFYSSKITNTLLSENNGIIGRYSDQGILRKNFQYMSENLFMPVGFGYSPDLFFGDSGSVEHLLRGSFPLFFLMYLGLFLFLYKNLHSKMIACFLFFITAAMDIGFLTLIFFRTLFILPFIIVFINHINQRNAIINTQ